MIACNDSYSEEEEEKNFFSEQLLDIISNLYDREDLMVMGDFNGRNGNKKIPMQQACRPI